tara:strand:- start:2839 stop:2961 length:123 start_codon:yes stop_codon:yes gene_type:complete
MFYAIFFAPFFLAKHHIVIFLRILYHFALSGAGPKAGETV